MALYHVNNQMQSPDTTAPAGSERNPLGTITQAVGAWRGLQANRMFTFRSYPKHPPLSPPMVGPEPEG